MFRSGSLILAGTWTILIAVPSLCQEQNGSARPRGQIVELIGADAILNKPSALRSHGGTGKRVQFNTAINTSHDDHRTCNVSPGSCNFEGLGFGEQTEEGWHKVSPHANYRRVEDLAHAAPQHNIKRPEWHTWQWNAYRYVHNIRIRIAERLTNAYTSAWSYIHYAKVSTTDNNATSR